MWILWKDLPEGNGIDLVCSVRGVNPNNAEYSFSVDGGKNRLITTMTIVIKMKIVMQNSKVLELKEQLLFHVFKIYQKIIGVLKLYLKA